MPIRHTVTRGDSLWSLAHRYLGGGARWPVIYDYHNQQAAKPGRPALLLPIKNPNLIYVSQLIMIPSRPKIAPPGTGARAEAHQIARPINMKVTYTIGRDTSPIDYVSATPDYTIKTEMSGDISVELTSFDRYRQSLELAISKGQHEIKQKLKEAYDPALCALTGKPGMSYDSETGKVTLEAPIAAQAGLGRYTVEMHIDAPNHFSGTLKPTPIDGSVKANGREYKYSADLEFKVDMIWNARPKGKVGEPVRVMQPGKQKAFAENPLGKTSNKGIMTRVEWIIVGIILALWGGEAASTLKGATTIQPFFYIVDPNNPNNQA